MSFLSLTLAYLIMSGGESAFVTDTPAGSNNLTWQQPTRRIMRGMLVGETRPYMVYLRPVANVANYVLLESHWLCGGVILDKRFILTSAACIENAGNFYVVSGTHKWVPPEVHDNECILNGARKAIWKCVPHTFFFDGDSFDNIRWMVGDIAIVKVEDNFNFERKIEGCDFVPKTILYNNRTTKLERSGTLATVVGWGSTYGFVNPDAAPVRDGRQTAENSVDLREADVIVITKKGCKRHWEERYHYIIDNEMICTKDSSFHEALSDACIMYGVDCKEFGNSEEDYYDDSTAIPISRRNMAGNRKNLMLHSAAHHNAKDMPTRRNRLNSGGFCENDHGGPLIEGHGKTSMVVGIMSACLTKELTHKCFGPFLYTSVYKHRNLISCAIHKDAEANCRRMYNDTNTIMKKTEFNWGEGSRNLPLNYKETKMRQWAEQLPVTLSSDTGQPKDENPDASQQNQVPAAAAHRSDHVFRFNIQSDKATSENPFNRLMRRFFS